MVWTETRSVAPRSLMKVACVLALLLSSVTPGHAQAIDADAYARELIRLINGLQKIPWIGWQTGTEVTIRYLVDKDAAGKPLGHEQPDLIFKVVETDKLLELMQLVKGKPSRREFLVKDQPGLDAQLPVSALVKPSSADLEIDGFKLSCLVNEISRLEIPGGVWTTKEWTLASHPSVVLQKEHGSSGWRVNSARVTKSVGGRDFSCVEIKKWMRFHSDGPADDLTTQYLCPDVPGHMVEQISEFFRIKKGQRSSKPFQVVHQKVVEVKALPLR